MCPFSKNNHLARCLVSGVTDGRDKGRNNSAWLCWRLLVQADQGCPRLRWAMVDHGSQLASSRRSLCQGQKLSYSCASLSALDKTTNPYCWHIQGSCLCLCPCSKKQPSCSLPSFWGRGRQRQQQDIAPGYASACWFKQTRGARGCAGPW